VPCVTASPKSSATAGDGRASRRAHAPNALHATATTANQRTNGARRTKGTSRSGRCPVEARGPVTVARVATSPSSEGLIEWRGREASPGFGAPKLAFPTAVSGVVSAGLKPRYSGGTAPESHRLPEPATAVVQLSMLNPTLA